MFSFSHLPYNIHPWMGSICTFRYQKNKSCAGTYSSFLFHACPGIYGLPDVLPYTGTFPRQYIVYGKIKVADFMEYWLEDVMKKRIADNTYNSYKNAVYNYISPGIGKMYMSTLNQGYIRKLYNSVTDQSENVARLVKTVMNTAMEYAKNKKMFCQKC